MKTTQDAPEGLSASACSAPLIADGHPEAVCHDCKGPNVVWFAPSDIWNRVVRTPDTGMADPMLCPRCFILRAYTKGIDCAWQIAPERPAENILK